MTYNNSLNYQPTQYGVVVGGANSTIGSVGPTATTGQILQSAGSSANPAFSTSTYPSTATGTGKILIADGTNWVASTPTYPNTSGTAGKVLVSDGTNNVYSTPTFPNASATSRKIIVSDGTNWVASTETYAVPGTTGNVMTSDGTNWTSAAAAASGSLVFLVKATASNSSSLDFTTNIDSTYPNYLFVIENIRLATAGTNFKMALSTNGLSSLATIDRSTIYTEGTATIAYPLNIFGLAATTGIPISAGISASNPTNTLLGAVRGFIYLYDPASSGTNTAVTSQLTYGSNNGTVYPIIATTSSYDTTAQTINSVRFNTTSGNLTSGNIYMYGIKGS